MEKNVDPWELLREARKHVDLTTGYFEIYNDNNLLARIDAALAGSQDKPLVKPPSTTWARFAFAFREQAERAERERDEARAEVERLRAALAERQDSATDVVEWEFRDRYHLARIEPFNAEVYCLGPYWTWRISRNGASHTESEAKSAAIAAARGLK